MRMILPLFVAALAFAARAAAQEQAARDGSAAEAVSQSALFAELAALDTALFTAAFDSCDTGRVRSLIDDDIEFLHDKGGLIYSSADQFMAELNCRDWVEGEAPRHTRRLVPGSLSVHPLDEWGAMQMGEHQFLRVAENGPDLLVGSAHFIHLWRRSPDGWRIARIVSYDHRAAE